MTTSNESQGPVTLRFRDPALEAEFQTKFRPRALRQLRASLLSSVALWLGLGPLLSLVSSSGRTTMLASIGMCGYLLASLWVSRFTRTARQVQLIVAASNTTAGLAAQLIVWDAGVFSSVGLLAAMFVVLFAFTMANLPFVMTVIAVTPYCLLCGYFMATSPDVTLAPLQGAFAIGMVGIMASATYMFESATPRDFVLRRVIADQERELEQEKAKQLGQYTLGEKLGQGGMGVVYKASHALLRRPTAIKLLTSGSSHAADLARFEKEVQLTSELAHPNIVAIYDFGHSPEGEFYYAMEYLPGVDLQTLVTVDGPMPVGRVIPIMKQICAALDDAHHRGLIHRDIKPANVIVNKIGNRCDVAKVVDFGLVREFTGGDASQAEDVVLEGTPAYLSPEAIIQPDQLGPPTDIYSLGALGYFLVTGKQLFTGTTVREVCAQHLHKDPPVPSEHASQPVPEAFDRVLLRCLAKYPAERYESAAALGEALDAIEAAPSWTDALAAVWWEAFAERRREYRARVYDTTTLEGGKVTVDMRRR